MREKLAECIQRQEGKKYVEGACFCHLARHLPATNNIGHRLVCNNRRRGTALGRALALNGEPASVFCTDKFPDPVRDEKCVCGCCVCVVVTVDQPGQNTIETNQLAWQRVLSAKWKTAGQDNKLKSA